MNQMHSGLNIVHWYVFQQYVNLESSTLPILGDSHVQHTNLILSSSSAYLML